MMEVLAEAVLVVCESVTVVWEDVSVWRGSITKKSGHVFCGLTVFM